MNTELKNLIGTTKIENKNLKSNNKLKRENIYESKFTKLYQTIFS